VLEGVWSPNLADGIWRHVAVVTRPGNAVWVYVLLRG
jgi:hypothetical protein